MILIPAKIKQQQFRLKALMSLFLIYHSDELFYVLEFTLSEQNGRTSL